MARDWEAFYADEANVERAPSPLLVEVADRLAPGRALDLACGAGRNAIYLARLGWRVTAIDASATAIRRLREAAAGLPAEARVADIERGAFPIEKDAYELVCCFY